MKIGITIHDAGMAANIGGGVESETFVIDIPENLIPVNVTEAIEQRERSRKAGRGDYLSFSLSLIREEK